LYAIQYKKPDVEKILVDNGAKFSKLPIFTRGYMLRILCAKIIGDTKSNKIFGSTNISVVKKSSDDCVSSSQELPLPSTRASNIKEENSIILSHPPKPKG